MKKVMIWVCMVALVMSVGCASGPSYLSRSVDDWQNTNYEADPLVTGLLTDVLPFYPIVGLLAAIPDYLVLNPVQFWGWDVWTGEGTAFTHEQPEEEHTPWFMGE